jgi:uncharacterized protein (TIGR02300 family)
MTTAKKKPSKSRAKAPARKKAPAKAAAARKKPAKATARREEPSPAPRPPERPARSRKRKSASAAGAGARPVTPASGADARSRLGAKWACFACGAKFYDLNKPEPLCPKCGANQHERPKRDPRPKVHVEAPPPPPRPVERERDVIAVEEDEDDGLIMDDEEIDLGGAEIDGDSDDFGDDVEEEEAGD